MRSWKTRQQFFSTHISSDLCSWLFDPTSLTARLKRLCSGDFRVKVISQGYAMPFADEALVLGMAARQYALIRQVRLYCGNSAVVFARSIIPVSTLTGPQRRLSRLGNRPLGAALFADKTMSRDEVIASCLVPGSTLHELSGETTGSPVWGRRSVFRLSGKPLLVSEYFLSTLF